MYCIGVDLVTPGLGVGRCMALCRILWRGLGVLVRRLDDEPVTCPSNLMTLLPHQVNYDPEPDLESRGGLGQSSYHPGSP